MNAKWALGWTCALLVLGAGLGGCGAAGSGGCVKPCYYGCTTFCNDFHDTSSDTGKELCGSNTWNEGKSCADLGYTKDCGSNTHVKAGDACT
jgi:hypothetical protein